MRLCIPLIDDPATLPTDIDKLQALVMIQDSHLRALAAGYEKLQKMLFGPRSEKVHTGEGQGDFLVDAAAEAEIAAPARASTREKKTPGHGRRPLPADLPRRRQVYDISSEEKICACGCEKKCIGEDVSEQLDFIPARLEVIVHARLKYACPNCADGVVEAAKPAQVIEKSLAAPGLLAHVIISKYADHIPLARQERIFAREGIDLSRSTMCGWTMDCADQVQPVIAAMRKRVLQSTALNTDDTSVPILEKDHTHRAYLWAYVGDAAHPYTVYDFTWTHSRAGPMAFLADYKGHVQADAYPGYDELFRNGMTELGCWAHARRKFVEAESTDGVYAPEAVKRIGALYEIERRAKEKSNADRRALRQGESVPLLEQLFAWMNESAIKVLPKSPTGEAFYYALSNRKALERYTEAGEFNIDNNAAERALRSVVVGRKNWLFAGSERGGKAAATFFTLVESARRNDVNVFDWLRDMLQRLPDHRISRIDEFLPDNWKKSSAAQQA
jgi:transposase